MNPNYFLASIFILFISFNTIAQNTNGNQIGTKEQLTFHLLDMEIGLAHNVVNSIEQDELGYIWIATIEGISRYNGTHFLNFKQETKNSENALVNNFIQQIALKKDGKLMIATDGGLNIYNLEKEKFDLINQKDGLLSNSISSVYEYLDGKIILGAYRYGIQFLDQNGKIEHTMTHDAKDIRSLSSNQISSITMQGDSVIWIGTFDAGLNKIDLKSKSNQRVFQSKPNKSSSQINSLHTDGNGNLWIGTKSGLKVITIAGDTLEINQATLPERGLSDSDILCFEEDQRGNIWIGTRNGGLNILELRGFLEKETPKIDWFLPKSDGSSVFNRTVSALKLDKKRNMWIGTSTGVNYVNPDGEPIKLLQRNPNSEQTLSHNRIGAIATGAKNRIWIGTDGGGLDRYSAENRNFVNYHHDPLQKESISSNYIISLKEDSKERLWVGTYQRGLNRMDISSGKFKKYLQGSSKDGSDVRIIAEDNKQQIWVGTNQGGLYLYDEENDTFQYIATLGKIDIRGIAFDARQRLWLATFGSGIICFDPLTDTFKEYHSSQYEKLPENIYFTIAVLPNQDILAGSRYGGLIRINPANDSITMFTEENGMSNNTINSMLMDHKGIVWLGTNNGISHYNPLTNHIDHINTFDNLQKSEFNIGAVTLADDGNLYFGGNKGINIINPTKINLGEHDYSLIFENFKLFNQQVKVGEEYLDSAISNKNSLTLNHRQSLISFDFSLLKFPFAQNVSYFYKLEGFHKHWIQVQGTGTANLSNIPPGSYSLLVRAKIGNEYELERQINLTITPPFWKTFPAYLLYFLLIVAIVIGVMRYYSERVKLKNSLLLEKQQRLLEHDINEERIRFFTSFSHELKTPLTLILAPIEDLINQVKSKTHLNKLTLVQKNAAYLHQLIGNLLEFRKAETGLSQLTVGEYNLSLYLEQWVQNYQPLAKKRHIQLTCSLSERNMLARFDFEKLQIIINNLLSNALKHAVDNDKIQVSLYSDEQSFYISVSDTGPGITAEDNKRIFEWFYQSGTKLKKEGTGIGLALSKSLTELHHGAIKVASEQGKGTTFIVEIPRDLPISSSEQWTSDQRQVPLIADTSILSLHESPYQEILVNGEEERPIILLIDDNTDILSYLDSLLRKKYDLIHAQDGEDGIQKALKHVPDLIISDIMMPLRDGLELCATLKKNDITSHIPIILLSAKGNVETMQTGFVEGADDYITKPFNSSLLQTRVQNLIESRQNLRKHFSDLGKNTEPEPLDAIQSDLLFVEKKFLVKLDRVILAQIGKEETQVETIVMEMGMSRTSLFRKIKAITGYNINTYIRMIKIKKAANLIANQKLPISQAAFESGFNDVKYFRKVFKEQFGVLPSAYKG
ncbi:ATP-binding protein [Belliella sp. R4-6]|uniref:histidine kinase n=1 Tax=Belliella alkalica TaxID=1730871 RepID=A0ABS9V7U9_9BACT|nr:two-component regulator propeller domain-containing protein [Belliella alkalica]MCH7412496.1 ATP-binding protein [Belliella alkalica]